MNRTVAALLLGCVAISPAESEAVAQEREYAIVNEQIEPIPLPFQAAVFRRAFRNVTDHALMPPYPDHGAVVRTIMAAGDEEYRKARGAIIGGGSDTPGYLTPSRTQLVPLSLEPGTQSTVRFAFAAEWLATDAAASLFPEAGTYSFKLYYDDELRIVVQAPRGDDKVILDQLRADPDLAAVMLSPINLPPEETLRSLERIVKLYSESSYADYARFALARHYAGPTLGGDLRNVSDDRQISISQLLKGIDASFAYAPEALVLLHRVLESRGQEERAERVMATLRNEFLDSTDFLDYLARQLSDEEWIEQNPRAPTPIPAAEADEE